MSKKIKAIAAAPGIAIGQVRWLKNEKLEAVPRQSNPDHEMVRLNEACKTVRQNIGQILATLQNRPDEAAIFNAHLMMLDDPDLLSLVHSKLGQGAEYAWNSTIQQYADQMDTLQDDYLRTRAGDIRDVGQQVLQILLGMSISDSSTLTIPVILLARDLTPSNTGRMDKNRILGFATQEGSSTSHTAILAKALGIPAVVGAGMALQEIPDDSFIILDGKTGEIIPNPDETTRQRFIQQQNQELTLKASSLSTVQQPATTADGHRVEVFANIGGLDEARNALVNGAEGVGLLRTEFLYMESKTAPEENTQYEIYRSIFEIMGTRTVIIRTLDIGGDKYPPYMDLGKEINPFLGWRAIRVCLDRPDFFIAQLRAILRAAVGHDIRIMFPMISTPNEFRRARGLLEDAKKELLSEEIPHAEKVQVGMMVEIPSAVILADLFAQEVDFFSIGTNDLTQYTFAADRTNSKVTSLAIACHPAIFRQVRHVVAVAHARDIWVGVCGELAGDLEAIPILLGLGVDELSMAPTRIANAKQEIRSWSLVSSEQIARKAIHCESNEEIKQLVDKASRTA